MTYRLVIGYVPLTDAAPVIVAHELGFAEEEGLELTLLRENSWSSLRDKLAYGVVGAAHLLSPMAIAMSLGLGPVRGLIDVPFVLNLNGNAFVAGQAMAQNLLGFGAKFGDAASFGKAAIQFAKKRPLRIGVPFLTSMHVSMLRLLVERLGGDAGDVFDFVVSPPSLIEEVLKSGEIDAFMVGAPWGSRAVDRGVGRLMLTSNSIWQAAPEKVLAMPHDAIEDNPETAWRLVRALHRASVWSSQRQNFSTLSEILSRERYLNVGADIIEQVVRGKMALDNSGAIASDRSAILFGGTNVSFPWKSAAELIAMQEAPYWGVPRPLARKAARNAFRTDIYRQALEPLNIALPNGSSKLEGSLTEATYVPASRELELGPDAFFDGYIFDPAQ